MTSVQGRAGRVGAAAIAALASRLTERDRLVALACYEHRVLTTEQLRRLHFGSSRRAAQRLAELYELRVLDRFRPPRQPGEGSAPYHWLLDEAGAHIAAEALGVERSELRWRHQAAIAIAASAKLAHQLEVNEFFTRLADEARAAGGRLAEWWGERRCLAALDGQAAPDGYGKLAAARPAAGPLPARARPRHRGSRAAAPEGAPLREGAPSERRSPTTSRCSSSPSPPRRGATTSPPRSPAAASRRRVIVWTPQHSPLAALRDALDDPTHEFPLIHPTDLAPLPAPHD